MNTNIGLRNTKNLYFYPWLFHWGGVQSNAHIIDGTGHYVALVFCSPITVTVSKIHVCTYGTMSFVGTLRFSIQGVNSSGNPDGTIKESGNAYGNPTLTTEWNNATLGTATTLTRGTWYSVVIDVTAYTSGMFQVQYNAAGYGIGIQSYNHLYTCMDLNAGSWTKGVNPIDVALEDSNGKLIPMIGVPGGSTMSMSTSTTPDELGNLIYMPFPVRAIGLYGTFDSDNGIDMKIYSDTTVVRTVSFDSNYRQGTSLGFMLQFFSDPIILRVGVPYRAVHTATSATGTTLRWYTFPSAAGLTQYSALGGRCIYTSRYDSGIFSQDDKKIAMCGIVCDMIPDGRRFSSHLGVYT